MNNQHGGNNFYLCLRVPKLSTAILLSKIIFEIITVAFAQQYSFITAISLAYKLYLYSCDRIYPQTVFVSVRSPVRDSCSFKAIALSQLTDQKDTSVVLQSYEFCISF